MRGGIDPTRQSRDDHDARCSELARQAVRDVRPVWRTRASADDRHRRPRTEVGRLERAGEETGRRIVDRPQSRWEQLVGAADPRDAVDGETSPIGGLVEGAPEELEATAARRVRHMLAGVCGENSDGQTTHAPSSRGER
jgi:hypothetical protein